MSYSDQSTCYHDYLATGEHLNNVAKINFGLTRKFIKLPLRVTILQYLNIVPRYRDILWELPIGIRLETDQEFRSRIMQELGMFAA